MAGRNSGRITDPKQTVQRTMDERRGIATQADMRESQRGPQRLDNAGDTLNDLVGPIRAKGNLTITEGLVRIEILNDDVEGLYVGPVEDPGIAPAGALYYQRISGKNQLYITDGNGFPVFWVLPIDRIVRLQYGTKLEIYDSASNALAGTISSLLTNVDVTGNWAYTGAVSIVRDGTLTFQVQKADLTKVFVVDTQNKLAQLPNGTSFRVYTDDRTTMVAAIDGATGALTQDGQATPANPAAGFAVLFPNTSNVYQAVDPNGDVWDVGKTQTVKKGSDQSISTTTLTTVTGMSFTLRANRVYFFEYFLVHQSGTSTTGLKLAINFTGTITEITYQTEIQVTNTVNGTANVEVQNHTANNSTHTAANQIANTTSSIAKVTGSIVVGASGGTLNLQFAGDAAASITAKQGSYGRLSF